MQYSSPRGATKRQWGLDIQHIPLIHTDYCIFFELVQRKTSTYALQTPFRGWYKKHLVLSRRGILSFDLSLAMLKVRRDHNILIYSRKGTLSFHNFMSIYSCPICDENNAFCANIPKLRIGRFKNVVFSGDSFHLWKFQSCWRKRRSVLSGGTRIAPTQLQRFLQGGSHHRLRGVKFLPKIIR